MDNRGTRAMRNSRDWSHQREFFSFKSCMAQTFSMSWPNFKCKREICQEGVHTLDKEWKLVSLRNAKRDNGNLRIEIMGVDNASANVTHIIRARREEARKVAFAF